MAKYYEVAPVDALWLAAHNVSQVEIYRDKDCRKRWSFPSLACQIDRVNATRIKETVYLQTSDCFEMPYFIEHNKYTLDEGE